MKTFNKFLLLAWIAILAMFSISSFALGNNDVYGSARTVILTSPQNLPVAGVPTTTNGPIDIRIFDGIATVTIESETNTGTTGGTLTGTLMTSTVPTNGAALTILTNFALSANQTITYTNIQNTNWTASSTYILPGTWTTPTAATAGWATPYLAAAPFTNAAAITLNPPGIFQAGVSIDDTPRYLWIVWTAGGSVTNWQVSAHLTGSVHSGQLSL